MAQAILLKDVENLGAAGEAVDVSPGYLRNYLVPRRLAQPATTGALAEAERRREAGERDCRAALENRAHDPAPCRRGRPALRLGDREGDRRRDLRRARPANRAQ